MVKRVQHRPAVVERKRRCAVGPSLWEVVVTKGGATQNHQTRVYIDATGGQKVVGPSIRVGQHLSWDPGVANELKRHPGSLKQIRANGTWAVGDGQQISIEAHCKPKQG